MRSRNGVWAAFALLAIAAWVFLTPNPVRTPLIDIQVRTEGGNNQVPPAISVIISNMSESMIVYFPEVEVVILRNGSWQTNSVSHAIGGVGSSIMMLKPHTADKPYRINDDLAPMDDVAAVRASLSATSLSWRGGFAWEHPNNPISSWLFGLDQKHRSKSESSKVVEIGSSAK